MKPRELRVRLEELERRGAWDDALALVDGGGLEVDEAERVRRRIVAKQRIFARVDEAVRGTGGRSFLTDEGTTVATRGEVRVEFRPGIAEVDVAVVFRAFDMQRDRLLERLGEPLDTRLTVVVYPARSRLDPGLHQSVLSTPEWAAGTADDHLRLFVGREEDPPPAPALAALVAHEMTHIVISRVTGGACPRWLDEGIALETTQELPEALLRTLNEAIREERWIPLELLAGPFEALEDTALVDLAYAQSASITRYLIGKIGWPRVAQLLRRMGELGSGDGALAEISLSAWLLEREWSREMRRRAGR